MKRSTMWMAVAALALTAGGVLVGRALATGAPTVTPLTYAGTVTDKDGKPYPTAVDVQVAFYDSLNATSPKCTAPLAKAEAGTGRFQVVLPVECVQAVHDVADLWSEAVVGPGKQVLPRMHVGAVPYALEADVASKAGGALKAEIDALKAGGGGGGSGGPWVVDATGVKLGKFLGIMRGLGSTAGWTGTDYLQFMTSTGHIVEARPKAAGVASVYGSVFSEPAPQVLFSEKGCKGEAGIDIFNAPGTKLSIPNRRSFFLHGAFFVPNGPLDGATIIKTDMTIQSSLNPGELCKDFQLTYATVIPLTKVGANELGVPDKPSQPLTVLP